MTHRGLGRGIVPAGVDAPYRETAVARPAAGLHLMDGSYGIQSQRVWAAGDNDSKLLIDAMRSEFLWRASVHGENLVLSLSYGTLATVMLEGLRLPFVGFIPGQVQLTATKLDPGAAAIARVTLTAATGGLSTVRMFVGVQTLPASASSFTALAAATLTVAGVGPIAVPVGATLPLVAPAAVTAGSGIVEITL